MNKQTVEIQLLTEVLNWIQLQKGAEWHFEKKKYKETDFSFVQEFLQEKFTNNWGSKKREEVYGFISARSIQRFCNEINGFEEKRTSVRENVPKALSAIAMKNRNPSINIQLEKRGEESEEHWKAMRNFSVDYQRLKELENSVLDEKGAIALLNEQLSAKNNEIKDLADAKTQLDSQNSTYEILNQDLDKQKKWKLGLAVLSTLLAVAVLILFFNQETPKYTQPHELDIKDMIGDSICQRNMYFRMKDTNLVWHFPKLTFYKFKNDTVKDEWIVKATGIYRDGEDYPLRMDSSIEHIGIMRRHVNFFQFELQPTNNTAFQNYGKWYATISIPTNEQNLENILKSKIIYGIGGGISKYKEQKAGLNKITSYVFKIDENQANPETLNEMSEQVDTSYKDARTRLLRTIFKDLIK